MRKEKMCDEIDLKCLKLLISGGEHFINEYYNLAIADYTSILKINANCLEARSSLAQAYLCIGDWDRAFAEMDTLMKVNPEFALKQPEIIEWYARPAKCKKLKVKGDGSLPF